MDTIRLGIVGIGNMGSAHSKSVSSGAVPGIMLTAVADRRTARRKWAEESLPPGTAIFEEGDALIESGLCDAALIATPHYQHPGLAEKAFANGLHVMCEKPAGVYAKQVRLMNEAAERSGLAFGMMFNQRTNCLYRKMHELVADGELGAIMRVSWIITDWFRTQFYYDSGDWRGTWAGEGGGVLLNQCPHQLDLLQWICGMPSSVTAFCHEGKWHDIEVEDDVTAYLEYGGGATGVFVTSTGDAPGSNRFEVSMEKGKLVCENGKLALYRLEESARDFCKTADKGFATPKGEWEAVETDGENPQHAGVLRAFADHILRGGDMVAGGAEGINGLMLSNAMHLSSWLKRPVSLPVDEDLFLAELDKRRAAPARKGSRKSERIDGKDITLDTAGSY